MSQGSRPTSGGTNRPALLSALQIVFARELRRKPKCAQAEGCRQRKHFKAYRTCGSARGENRKLRHRRKRIAAVSQAPPRHVADISLCSERRQGATPAG